MDYGYPTDECEGSGAARDDRVRRRREAGRGLISKVGNKPADERGKQQQKTLINTPPQTDGSGSERRGGMNAKMWETIAYDGRQMKLPPPDIANRGEGTLS